MAYPPKSNNTKNNQFELFGSNEIFPSISFHQNNLEHTKESLMSWRKNIYNYQKQIIESSRNSYLQQSLIESQDIVDLKKINPFLLSSFSINFWRSNKSVHKGPAMYFVIDNLDKYQIILYIGETNSADKRWKGDHDCKNYINNYRESMSINDLKTQLDIRFYLDVPKDVKLRRKLEKSLIYLWLPPFNKETRDRWTTTFTNN